MTSSSIVISAFSSGLLCTVLTGLTPDSSLESLSSTLSRLSSISGVISLINSSSATTLFCVAVFNLLESSDKFLIYRIRVSLETVFAFSFKFCKFWSDMSTSELSFCVDLSIRIFLRYHRKSVTNCPISFPSIMELFKRFNTSIVLPSSTPFKSSLNTLISEAPSISSTAS